MSRVRGSLRASIVICAVLAALVTSACAFPQDGRAVAGPEVTAGIDPSFVQGTDGSDQDRLAAAVLRDLEGYWGQTFPTLPGGQPFAPLKGYYSVDPSGRSGRAPAVPCLRNPREVEGTAFYCPDSDIIAWDRAGLLPQLRREFGDAAVVVVISHEFGHSVQQRLDRDGTLRSAPTIVLEAQADCYAGVFLRRVRDGSLPDLRTGVDGIDGAMGALITFRDPVGTSPRNADAHGNAFDRVTSFQDGFDGAPATCAGITQDRTFTQQSFRSADDENSGGNLGLDPLIRSMQPDLDRFFGGLVRQRGGQWATPGSERGRATCGDSGDDEVQGPVAWCATPSAVHIDTSGTLAADHARIGDYATGTLLASRYGTAALAAMGKPTTGAEGGRAALCLAGAYSAAVGTGGSGFALSPGDLDEAVTLLLREDTASRGTDGVAAAGTGYERIRVFRAGVDQGADACLRGV
ncbi:neutral zinc metallopeptidase [Actinomycetospora sp. NBRC 106375]|uniref:neutral zinc metallopeptidase n=1 Tax=Actinomycetospora sp. NBRC 106375 TaxID=3032207 RepID=UPI0025578E00|nr:neutral zinc metallopeptidase [Actinomycetospora sp. NBRC 106375]